MSLSRGFHVRANAIRLHALHHGSDGPPVVVVPGIVSPAVLWAHVAGWLAAACECFVLDVRGRGLSESGPHLDYGIDACSDDLCAFVRVLEKGPVTLVGHSMGARIAARAAARSPALFRSLVLLDPPTSGPGRRPYPVPMERTLGLLRACCRGEGLAAIQSGPGKRWPQELECLRAEWLCTCDERAVLAAYEDFHRQDFFADLAAAKLPASLVCAGEGGVVSDQDIADMRRLRGDLLVVRIAGVGHQMQAEDFAAFREALVPVLRRHHPAFERIAP